ncbi:MAG: hypothetical protein WCQ77_05230 [Planctomycetota bacterium]
MGVGDRFAHQAVAQLAAFERLASAGVGSTGSSVSMANAMKLCSFGGRLVSVGITHQIGLRDTITAFPKLLEPGSGVIKAVIVIPVMPAA